MSRVGCQPRRAKRGLTGRVPGMVFWGDLYDDFLDHSVLRSGNGTEGGVWFSCVTWWWVCEVGGHLPRSALAGDCAGAAQAGPRVVSR